jgi:hypothetical protein
MRPVTALQRFRSPARVPLAARAIGVDSERFECSGRSGTPTVGSLTRTVWGDSAELVQAVRQGPGAIVAATVRLARAAEAGSRGRFLLRRTAVMRAVALGDVAQAGPAGAMPVPRMRPLAGSPTRQADLMPNALAQPVRARGAARRRTRGVAQVPASSSVEPAGIEPATSCLQSRRSPN